MKYTITGQISVFPLDKKFRQCVTSKATQQLEIYSAGNCKIAFTSDFNKCNFSYPVGSRINFIPTGLSIDILIGRIKKSKEREK